MKTEHSKLKTQQEQLDIPVVMVSSDRFGLGIKKYGYNSEFRKEYEGMTAQLRHDELNKFFDKWEVPKN